VSGFSNNSDRDRVLAATDIVALIGEVVALRPKGREHVGLCPFHDDRSPSMAVVTHKANFGGSGFYKCFACGAAGNAIDFVINYHKMEFPEALRFLAGRAGVELTPWDGARRERSDGEPTRDEVLRANALAEKFFRRVYADETAGLKAREEVARRGIEHAIAEAFGLGAAPARGDALVEGIRKAQKNAGPDYPPFEAFVAAGVIRPARSGGGHIDLLRDRLVFPIRDELGRAIAFGGRKLDPEQEPKYLNSPESPVFHKSKALYGIDLAKQSIVKSDTAVITEGYTDVIACHRFGVTNAVATLGTALTRDHARVLRRLAKTVILLFDGDEAGQKAADRALSVFFSESVDIKICVLPDNLDPDDLLRQEGGPERFRTALARSEDALSFVARRIRSSFVGKGLSARQAVIEQTMAKFVDAGLNAMAALRRQLVMQALAEMFDVGVSDLDRLARSLRPRGVGAAETTDPEGGARAPGEFASDGSSGASTGFIEVPPAFGSAARLRARREAERRLLGILCTDPALASIAVPVEGAGTLPLSEAIAPSEFADPAHAAIFAALRDAAESARVLTFDGLLGELPHGTLKSLASDLYMFGTEVMRSVAAQGGATGQARSASEEVVVSWRDLEEFERRARFQVGSRYAGQVGERATDASSGNEYTNEPAQIGSGDLGARSEGPLDPGSAVERLARLRERGHDATAFRELFRRRQSPGSESGRSTEQ
jgi:DNA primase